MASIFITKIRMSKLTTFIMGFNVNTALSL
jgi:hypothetical protein